MYHLLANNLGVTKLSVLSVVTAKRILEKCALAMSLHMFSRNCLKHPVRQQVQLHRSHVSSPVIRVRSRDRHAARAAASAPGASRAELESMLARKEAQLASMFEAGRLMPKAAEVAKLRAEVAALADQLAGRPVQPLVDFASYNNNNSNSSNSNGGYRPSMPPSVSPMGAIGSVAQPLQPPRSSAEELAFKAYDMVVEQQLRSNQGMGNSEDAEIARLEAENTQLRAEAYDLLKRQQELETLLAEVKGAKAPEMLLDQTEGILARMKAKLQRQS